MAAIKKNPCQIAYLFSHIIVPPPKPGKMVPYCSIVRKRRHDYDLLFQQERYSYNSLFARFKPPPSGGQISSPLLRSAYNSPPHPPTMEVLWIIDMAVTPYATSSTILSGSPSTVTRSSPGMLRSVC